MRSLCILLNMLGGSRMARFNLLWVAKVPTSLLVMGTLLTAPSVAHASLIVLTSETLMEAQVVDAIALEAYAGPDFSTSLQYAYTLNTDNGSFSYSLLPGQSYLGQAFSLSGSGTYDPVTTTFNWTDSGALGSIDLSGSGEVQWTGDPTATINFNDVFTSKVDSKTTTLNFQGTVDVDSQGHSSGDLTLKDVGENFTIGTVSVTDNLSAGSVPGKAMWTATITTAPLPSLVGGQYTWKSGDSTATFAVVPEPPTWAIMLLGLVGLVCAKAAFCLYYVFGQ